MKSLLQQWGTKFKEAEITPIKSRIWQIEAGSRVYILKRRGNRSSVWGEYDLMGWLISQGLPVSQLLCTIFETPWAEYEGGIFVLYPYLPGISGNQVERLEEGYAQEIGSGLARLHSSLAAYRSGSDFGQFDLFQDVSGYAWPAVRSYLGARFRPQLKNIEQEFGRNFVIPYEALPRQLIHCNFHPGNLVFDGNKLSGILDFDRARIAVRLFDLCFCSSAQLAADFSDLKRREAWPKFVQDLLRGYGALYPLSKTEAFLFLYIVYLIQFLFIAYRLDAGNTEGADHNIAMLLWINDQHEFLAPIIEKAAEG